MLDNSGAKILLTKRALIKGDHYDVPVIELEDPSCWLSDSSNPDSVSKRPTWRISFLHPVRRAARRAS
jgi:hypothetical protein